MRCIARFPGKAALALHALLVLEADQAVVRTEGHLDSSAKGIDLSVRHQATQAATGGQTHAVQPVLAGKLNTCDDAIAGEWRHCSGCNRPRLHVVGPYRHLKLLPGS